MVSQTDSNRISATLPEVDRSISSPRRAANTGGGFSLPGNADLDSVKLAALEFHVVGFLARVEQVLYECLATLKVVREKHKETYLSTPADIDHIHRVFYHIKKMRSTMKTIVCTEQLTPSSVELPKETTTP